jgi:hypothetical protein
MKTLRQTKAVPFLWALWWLGKQISLHKEFFAYKISFSHTLLDTPCKMSNTENMNKICQKDYMLSRKFKPFSTVRFMLWSLELWHRNLMGWYWYFGGIYWFHLQGKNTWIWRYYVPLKHLYWPTWKKKNWTKLCGL